MNCGKGLFSMKFKGLNYTYFGSLDKSDKKCPIAQAPISIKDHLLKNLNLYHF